MADKNDHKNSETEKESKTYFMTYCVLKLERERVEIRVYAWIILC